MPHPFSLDMFYTVPVVEATVSYLDMPGTYGKAFDVIYRVWAPESGDITELVLVAEDTLGPYIDQDLKHSYAQFFPDTPEVPAS